MKQYEKLCFCLFLILPHMLCGQEKGEFQFSESEHDFGTVKDNVKSIEHEFKFKNTGDTPIIISYVKASCGCTTPGWSSEAVAPGEEGYIKAKYSTVGRSGTFRKTLTITSNIGTDYLYIKGKVIPGEKPIEERLRYKTGTVRLKSKNLNFSNITDEKPITKSFEIYNDSPDTLYMTDRYDGPSFIQVTMDSTYVLPNELGELNVQYDPRHGDHLGMNNHGIDFYMSDSDEPKSISVIARVSEYFPALSEKEKKRAPRLLIEERVKDLGTVSEGSKTTVQFLLRNDGVDKLNIRKIDTNCSCLSTKLDAENIRGGDAAWLTITFDSTKRRGRQTKSISIFSNDPYDPTQLVSIKVSVSQ